MVIGGRSADKLDKARGMISPDARAISIDSSNQSSVQEFFKAAGPIDHLFITAAEAVFSEMEKNDEVRLKAALDGKYWGSYYSAKYALPQMSKSGSITFISGLAAWKGYPADRVRTLQVRLLKLWRELLLLNLRRFA